MAHILVVDDEVEVRRLVRDTLKRDGHSVHEEPDGLLVTASVLNRRPDLVIVDLAMPGKNGLETIIALRRIDSDLKILAISGTELLEAAARLGANAVLSKPFRTAELRKIVGGLVNAGAPPR